MEEQINDKTKEFIPSGLRKKNKYGAFSNGIWLAVVLSGAIIIIQTIMPQVAKREKRKLQ